MKGVSIDISGLGVSYGDTRVLTGIDLSVAPGEFIALLGASGCGKTTLLRALAGLVPVGQGRVTVGERDMTRLPPEKRGMAMMFQSYALWPHMTVAQNVGYALRLRRLPRAEIAAQVDRMLSLVGLSGFADRNVTRLSGGQRQRVALARALAVDPPVLLLDEPLSNLDARIRLSMRHEVKALQKTLGLTTLLVTHDREEAMAMADRVVILNHGRIEQIGTPEEIYHRPASAYVAAFMGAENTSPVTVSRQRGVVRITPVSAHPVSAHPALGGAVSLPEEAVNCRVGRDGAAMVHFRSEAARLAPRDGGSGAATNGHSERGLVLSGAVRQHSYLGNVYRHTVEIGGGNGGEMGGQSFLVDHPMRMDIDTAVDICVPAAALHIFERTGSAAASPAGERNAHPTKEAESVA